MIIFTDLDGSLLNHTDYSYRNALPALRKIRAWQIPLIMCTSKTCREVEALMADMHIREPFIVENGGGVFFPPDYRGFRIEKSVIMHSLKCIPLGVPYGRIRIFMKQAALKYSIRGFGDMTEEEIAIRTGLPKRTAALAKVREFTEPFIIEHKDQLPDLEREAGEAGFKITRGGRFFHFLGSGNNKGEAVNHTRAVFERNLKGRTVSVGLGDSLNDLPMLEQVDIPVLIPHPDGSYEDISLPNLIRAPYPGSRGWNEVISTLLDTCEGVENQGWKISSSRHMEKRLQAMAEGTS